MTSLGSKEAMELIAGLKGEAGAGKTMNGGSIERRNGGSVKLGSCSDTFRDELWATRRGGCHVVWGSGTVSVAGYRHASGDQTRAARRSHRRRPRS